MRCIPPNPSRVGYIDPIHEPLDGPLYMGSYIHQQFDNCGEVEKDDLLLMQGCASSFSLGKIVLKGIFQIAASAHRSVICFANYSSGVFTKYVKYFS